MSSSSGDEEMGEEREVSVVSVVSVVSEVSG
jgi:hypothetical protein